MPRPVADRRSVRVQQQLIGGDDSSGGGRIQRDLQGRGVGLAGEQPGNRSTVVAEAADAGIGERAERGIQRLGEGSARRRVRDRERSRDRTAADQDVPKVEISKVVDGRLREVVSVPVTVIGDELGNANVVNPLVPVPFDASPSVTVPLRAPAVAVLRPTTMLLLLEPFAARLVIEPEALAAPVDPATVTLRPSWKEVLGAFSVFVTFTPWLATDPTCTLPRFTLVGMAGWAI